MGNRLSKIYTKTGDDGTTGLGDGTRVAKDSARVAAYGTVDEANSAIGLLLAGALPDDDTLHDGTPHDGTHDGAHDAIRPCHLPWDASMISAPRNSSDLMCRTVASRRPGGARGTPWCAYGKSRERVPSRR